VPDDIFATTSKQFLAFSAILPGIPKEFELPSCLGGVLALNLLSI
jgi:hypothetical protein